MTDDALVAWLEGGAKPEVSADEAVARQRAHFCSRFAQALKAEDLGPTEEIHQAAVARLVYAIHLELNALGETEYLAVWQTFPASMRAALKKYVEQGKKG